MVENLILIFIIIISSFTIHSSLQGSNSVGMPSPPSTCSQIEERPKRRKRPRSTEIDDVDNALLSRLEALQGNKEKTEATAYGEYVGSRLKTSVLDKEPWLAWKLKKYCLTLNFHTILHLNTNTHILIPILPLHPLHNQTRLVTITIFKYFILFCVL